MEADESPVVHIEVNYQLYEQRDEDSEDCIYAIDTFTVWTEDRVYVSDSSYGVRLLHTAPPARKEIKRKSPVNYEHDSEPMVIKN